MIGQGQLGKSCLVAGVSSTQLTAVVGSAASTGTEEHAAARQAANPGILGTPRKSYESGRPPAVVREKARPLGAPGSKPVCWRAPVIQQQTAGPAKASDSGQTGSIELQQQAEQVGQQGSGNMAPLQRPQQRLQSMQQATLNVVKEQPVSQPSSSPALSRLGDMLLQRQRQKQQKGQQRQKQKKDQQQQQQQRQQQPSVKQHEQQQQQQQAQVPPDVTEQQPQDMDVDTDPLPRPELVLQHFVQPQPQPQQSNSLTQSEPALPQKVGGLGLLGSSLGATQPGSSAVTGRRRSKVQPSSQQMPQQLLSQQQQQQRQQQTALGRPTAWEMTSERAHTAAQSLKKMEVTRAGNRGARYRGTTRHRRTQRWEAHIWLGGRQVYLGSFSSQEEAAMAHDLTSIRFCGGRRAVTNFYLESYGPELADLEAKGVQEPVASLPATQQAAVRGGGQQELQNIISSNPDWQWWRETLKAGTKSSSSTSSTSLSQLAAAAVELDSMPEAPSRPTTPSNMELQQPDTSQRADQPQPSRKRKRVLSTRLKDALITGPLTTIKQLTGALAPDPSLDPNASPHQGDPDQGAQGGGDGDSQGSIPSAWGLRRERSSKVQWPPGCSARLKASLAGQNGLAALRAAGITEMYRQRLEASLKALGTAAAAGQGGADWESTDTEDSSEEEEVDEPSSSSSSRGQLKRRRGVPKRGGDEAVADAAAVLGQGRVVLGGSRRPRQQQQHRQQPQRSQQQSQQRQLKLLLRQLLAEQEGASDSDEAEKASEVQQDALEALAMAAAAEQASPAAAAAAESPMPGSEVVFQAMAAVLFQLETHSFGLGACITELMADWADTPTQKLLQSAAATAAQSAAGIAAMAAAAQAGDLVTAQQTAARAAIIQQHQHRSLVQRLLGHCLDLQGAGDQLLRRMRQLIAPYLPQNARAGRGFPDNSGNVMVAVQQLQGLHRQHATILKSMAAALRQLRAALSAVVIPAQESSAAATLATLARAINQTVTPAAASRSGSGGAPAAVSLDELAAHLAQVLNSAEKHAVGSMKLLGVSLSSS